MFQPIGPNLRRSWIIAWKKQKPNKSFLNSLDLVHPLNYSSDKAVYDLSKFARRPWGGSSVIFTPFCSTEIGKEEVGIEVSQSLKSPWVFSLNYSTNFYNSGIHEAAKWQFWSSIHDPLSSAYFTSSCALGPWPCPREMDFVFLSRSFANLRKSVTGSEPGESRKISGVKQVESLKHFPRSKVGGRINYLPSFSQIQF